MSEDLFSYSNTGEPKQIVRVFVDEVVTSIDWLTTEAKKVSLDETTTALENGTASKPLEEQQHVYEEILNEKVRDEKKKLWKSLMTATLNVFGDGNNHTNIVVKANENDVPVPSTNDTVKLGSTTATVKARESLAVFHRLEVLSFLKRARAAYGRTALCLSGGAMMGT